MAKRIITISREFGSGGRFIGEEVAKKLGIAYYDKNIIGQIAEKSGLSPEYIQENAELSPKKGLFAYAFSGRDITGKSVEDMVYEVQRNIILELAEKEPCVIIGRNADYILKDRDDVLNVFIHGDMSEKIKWKLCVKEELEMAKRIITISREFGSGGRFIGEEIAKKLGIAYYDKNIISQIAEKSGLSPEYIQENAELSPKKGLFAYAFAGRDITGRSVEDMVYQAQRKVILDLVRKEPCVIIGRNADYILKDRDDILNVFIHGDMPEKIQRISQLYRVTEQEAVKMMADTDKRRMTNYNFYTDQKWGKASNYTLCLNSSQIGYDRCEAIIIECVK